MELYCYIEKNLFIFKFRQKHLSKKCMISFQAFALLVGKLRHSCKTIYLFSYIVYMLHQTVCLRRKCEKIIFFWHLLGRWLLRWQLRQVFIIFAQYQICATTNLKLWRVNTIITNLAFMFLNNPLYSFSKVSLC